MNAVSRGIRNAFRNSVRSFSIILILGLSIGLALAMLVARAAVKDKITSVKTSIGNTITVTPAGTQGFDGGGEPLTNDQIQKVRQLSNVTNVVATLSDRLTMTDTNLVSAIQPGTLGNRGARNSGIGFSQRQNANQDQQNGQQPERTFTPPVVVTGADNANVPQAAGGSYTITDGKIIDFSKDENSAIVGKALADKNGLHAGSTFTAYGNNITVSGIFDTGNAFTNAGLSMSLASLQRLSNQPASITSALVTVSSIDATDSVVNAIKSQLGSAADVTNNQESAKQAVAPLESVKNVSTFSLIGAVIAGSVIILLTMVMVVRERRREVGVYKAIGASNITIVFQFICEAVTLTVLALVAGLIIGTVAANPVTKVLVNNSTSNAQQTQQAAPGQGGQRGFGRGLRGFGGNTGASVRNIKTEVGLSIIGYGAAAALIIAVLGSAAPAFLISKIRPAEVMRSE